MKKMLALLLVGIMALGNLGIVSFADEVADLDYEIEAAISDLVEELEDIDTTDLNDEEVEEILADIVDDLENEELSEEEFAKKYYHSRFNDEMRKLYNERKETKRLLENIGEKKTKIEVLKERANLKGESWKIERVKSIEKEVRIIKKSIDHIRDRKSNLWDTFKTQFRAGDYKEAEVTLKNIVATKIIINNHLKLVLNLLIKEITVLK